jgi:hypothetical protein
MHRLPIKATKLRFVIPSPERGIFSGTVLLVTSGCDEISSLGSAVSP